MIAVNKPIYLSSQFIAVSILGYCVNPNHSEQPTNLQY